MTAEPPRTLPRIDGDHDGTDTDPIWIDRAALADIGVSLLFAGFACGAVIAAAHSEEWRMTGPLGTATLAAMVAAGGNYIYLRMSRREQAGR